jgi:hypothetical protein
MLSGITLSAVTYQACFCHQSHLTSNKTATTVATTTTTVVTNNSQYLSTVASTLGAVALQ